MFKFISGVFKFIFLSIIVLRLVSCVKAHAQELEGLKTSRYGISEYEIRKCKSADQVIRLAGSRFGMSPNYIEVRQGDTVCFIQQSLDRGYKKFNIQGDYQVPPTVSQGNIRISIYRARKVGEYTITCRGCSNATSKLVVKSQDEYDEKLEEYFRENSYRNRRFHWSQ